MSVTSERVRDSWPEKASTIAPLLCAGVTAREFFGRGRARRAPFG
jgi:hypothetical protein